MLSGILKSETAIRVNIQIIRLFTKMRKFLQTHKEILHKIEKTDQKIEEHDKDIEIIFKYLKRLLDPPKEPRKKVGFRRKGEE